MVEFELSSEYSFGSALGQAYRKYLYVINNGKRIFLTSLHRFEGIIGNEYDYSKAKSLLESYLLSNGEFWYHKVRRAYPCRNPYVLLDSMRANKETFINEGHLAFSANDYGDGLVHIYGVVSSNQGAICFSFSSHDSYNAWADHAKLIDPAIDYSIKL